MILPRIVHLWTSEQCPTLSFVEFPTTYNGKWSMCLCVLYAGKIIGPPLSC